MHNLAELKQCDPDHDAIPDHSAGSFGAAEQLVELGDGV
jgi:hypothetical protein